MLSGQQERKELPALWELLDRKVRLYILSDIHSLYLSHQKFGVPGIPGPSGAPGIAYAYLGCYYHTSSARVLSYFQQTFTVSINAQCSELCNTLKYNFFATVYNAATSSGDCYCGNTLNLVALLNLGTGAAKDDNCAPCGGGPNPPGACGIATSSTAAVYARAF